MKLILLDMIDQNFDKHLNVNIYLTQMSHHISFSLFQYSVKSQFYIEKYIEISFEKRKIKVYLKVEIIKEFIYDTYFSN